ncbi:hypothetical protein CO2235_U950015 [Cupriavidus oxalaticus]|uniref:Uncharacterized protein n=1 Tax=Cupriavidus oxalaticus TaxID=96344 RepID=A0A375FVF2_9BURK|nr:hypothetical protein CO2235_U950015 [Cupriavidus oxalaticus]
MPGVGRLLSAVSHHRLRLRCARLSLAGEAPWHGPASLRSLAATAMARVRSSLCHI